MKRVLVTGARGFLGRRVVPHLISAGFEVHAWYRSAPKIQEPNVVTHVGDLLDEDQQPRILESAQATNLLHLAWYTEHGKFWESTENLRWTAASLHLLKNFAEAGGKRCVIAGTCAEYEWTHETFCKEGETATRSLFLYGVCKDSLHKMATAASNALGLEIVWGRIFLLYGPGESPERFVPSVILSLLEGKTSHCRNGDSIRDFMHVDDVARAFTTVLDSPHTGAVNIASGMPQRLGDIAREIGSQLNRSELLEIGTNPSTSNEPQTLTADTRALQSLGFVPRISLEEGIAETIAWWRSKSSEESQQYKDHAG